MNEPNYPLCQMCLHQCKEENRLICKKFIPAYTLRSYQYKDVVSLQPIKRKEQRSDGR